jgi:hypothetical protein
MESTAPAKNGAFELHIHGMNWNTNIDGLNLLRGLETLSRFMEELPDLE